MNCINVSELMAHLDRLLCPEHFKDYSPNGLQVEGANTIHSVCSAVTASLDVIEKTAARGAKALLVHHGFFWKGESSVIVGSKRSRIATLLSHNINLLAYHLPLDCHPTLGNNYGLGSALGVLKIQHMPVNNTPSLLWFGEFETVMDAKGLAQLIETKLHRRPQIIQGHKRNIKKIAWCTGGAQDLIEEAAHLGVDAYISGEISERTYYQAMELGMVYVSAGHHATERFGVKSLGNYLQNTFGIEHHFIDTANPV